MGCLSAAQLELMVEEATVDCNDEDEQAMGLFTMLQDNLELPLETVVLGVGVTVEELDMTDRGQIVAVCHRDKLRQRIAIVDLPLPARTPAGAEWIAAYRRWHG